jgi:hypothetical protein
MEWSRDQDLPGPLDWNSRYEVGVSQLDADHRELVRLIIRQAIGQDAKIKAYFGRREWE